MNSSLVEVLTTTPSLTLCSRNVISCSLKYFSIISDVKIINLSQYSFSESLLKLLKSIVKI